VATARQAFVDGLQHAMVVAAVVAGLGAVAVGLLLPARAGSTEGHPAPTEPQPS
jgi:multisubunit Na+/H+ antiporter MnhC subunit